MEITQKFIAAVKRKRVLNQAWHDVMTQKEAEAVEYALAQAEYYQDTRDVIAEARRFMALVWGEEKK